MNLRDLKGEDNLVEVKNGEKPKEVRCVEEKSGIASFVPYFSKE